MKILEELWHQGLHPSEAKRDTNLQYLKQQSKVDKNAEKLLSMLSEDGKKIFEKFMDDQAELSCIDNCEIFASGFRMGARMMLEVMEEKDGDRLTNEGKVV